MENQLIQLAFKAINYNGNIKLSWAQYGEFKVIMIMEGKYKGYINASKLVSKAKNANGNYKDLRDWVRLDNSALFSAIESSVHICTDDLTYKYINCENDYKGTYCHYKLIPHIASWASAEFAVKVSDIVTEYILKESNEKIAKLQIESGEKSILIQKYSDEVVQNLEKIESQKVEIEANKIEITSSKIELTTLKIEIIDLKEIKNSLINDIEMLKKQRVIPTDDAAKNEQLCLLKLNDGNCDYTYYSIRCQESSINSQIRKIKQRHRNSEVILKINQSNAKNLWIRIIENYGSRGDKSISFDRNYFYLREEVFDEDAHIISAFMEIHNQRNKM